MIERHCGKATFTDKGKADKEIQRIRKAAGRRKRHARPVRSYKCPDCQWWHLTSLDEWIDHGEA